MADDDVFKATLCWIVKDGKALLKFANRGISKGKWNAVGGGIDPGETPLECVKRETFEETGLRIQDPSYHGKVRFFFGDPENKEAGGAKQGTAKQGIVHVFSTSKFTGELKGSDEGELRWFDLEDIPFDKMWEDDDYWVPLLLSGRRFEGDFYFSEDGSKLMRHRLHVKD